MLVAPSITWLLVSTSPDGLITIPVPAPRALESPSWVSMSTTAGSTPAARAERSSAPLDGPEVTGSAAIGDAQGDEAGEDGHAGAVVSAGHAIRTTPTATTDTKVTSKMVSMRGRCRFGGGSHLPLRSVRAI